MARLFSLTSAPSRTLFGAAVLAAVAPVSAQDHWEWSAEIYAWMPEINATTASGSDATLDFDSILSDLNFTFMANVEASRDRWTLFGDLVYLDIEDKDRGTLQIGPITVEDQLKWRSRTIISEAGVAYEVASADNYSFRVLGGARYLHLKTDIDLTVGPVKGSVSDTETFLDGVVGIEGRLDLSDRWYFSYYADVGTGDSDVTWQALGAFSYRFERFDFAAGWRYLDWQFDDTAPLDELTVNGPYIGARFNF